MQNDTGRKEPPLFTHKIFNFSFRFVPLLVGVFIVAFSLTPRSINQALAHEATGGQVCQYCVDTNNPCSADPACVNRDIDCNMEGTNQNTSKCKYFTHPGGGYIATCEPSNCGVNRLWRSCQ